MIAFLLQIGYMNLIGRNKQKKQIVQYYTADTAHFVAVYGRRRVGKTFLIKEYFKNEFIFYCIGLIKGNKTQQLQNFTASLKAQLQYEDNTVINNWYDAFTMLIAALKQTKTTDKKQVLFMNELP
jgi:uncharacterized protein